MEWKRSPSTAVMFAVVVVSSAMAIAIAPSRASAQQMQLQSIYGGVSDLGTFLGMNIQAIESQLQVQGQLAQASVLQQTLQANLQSAMSLASSLRASMTSVASDMSQMVSSVHVSSCPVFAGASTLLVEDGCVWAKVTGRLESRSAGSAATSLQGEGVAFRIGGQKQVGPGWFLGGTAGYGGGWWQAGNGASANSQKAEGAVAVKRVDGPLLLMGALGFAATGMHIDRPDGVPGPGGVTLRSDSSAWQGSGRLRAAYDIPFGQWYLRPRLDLDLLYTNMPGYQEYGQSALALQVAGRDKWSIAITPAIEVGGRTELSEGLILRPYLVLGASFMPDNNWTTVASFQGALGTLGSFQITTWGPSVMANAEIGVQLYRANGFEMKAEYILSAGDSLLTQMASLRGAWHF